MTEDVVPLSSSSDENEPGEQDLDGSGSSRDEELLKLLKVDQYYYFTIVVEEFGGRIYKYVYSQEKDFLSGEQLTEHVKDVVQETFKRFYRRLQSIEARPFKQLYHFAYLRRIATNVLKERWRVHSGEVSLDAQKEVDEAPATQEMGLNEANRRYNQEYRYIELVIDVKSAIESMNEPYKTSLRLRLLEELSYAEIAKIMQCPIGTAKSYVSRGRVMLRKLLSR